MSIRLPEHDHCGYCGDPIPYDMNYCSQDCLDAFLKEDAIEKKKDRRLYLLLGISVIAIAIIAVAVNL